MESVQLKMAAQLINISQKKNVYNCQFYRYWLKMNVAENQLQNILWAFHLRICMSFCIILFSWYDFVNAGEDQGWETRFTEAEGDKPTHSRANPNVPACWISPHLMVSIWSRFLRKQTETPTHRHTHTRTTCPHAASFIFQNYGLWSLVCLEAVTFEKGKLTHHHPFNLCTLVRCVQFDQF